MKDTGSIGEQRLLDGLKYEVGKKSKRTTVALVAEFKFNFIKKFGNSTRKLCQLKIKAIEGAR